jgi:Tfp pilus assembly protein PilE
MIRLIILGVLAYLVYRVVRSMLPQYNTLKASSKLTQTGDDLAKKYDIQDADFEDIDESS